MSRHSQQAPRDLMVCPRCKDNKCNECVNIPLILLGRPEVCLCDKKAHNGEPNEQQVKDPFTGTVHAPGLTVDTDGNVDKSGTFSSYPGEEGWGG